jgi:hypothetical protein
MTLTIKSPLPPHADGARGGAQVPTLPQQGNCRMAGRHASARIVGRGIVDDDDPRLLGERRQMFQGAQ